MADARQIENVLLEFLRDELLDSSTPVHAESALDELGIDSFALLELVIHIERACKVTIPAHMLTRENTRSVRTLASAAASC